MGLSDRPPPSACRAMAENGTCSELASAFDEMFGQKSDARAEIAAPRPNGYTINVEELGLPIMVADPDGNIVHLNSSFKAALASSKMVLAELTFTDLLQNNAQHSQDQALRNFQETIAGSETRTVEVIMAPVETGVETHSLLLTLSSRTDADGRVLGIIGVGQDQTHALAELSRVANDMTLLIETANAPIFGIDTKGYVNEWNRKAAQITGFSKDEVMGQDLVQQYITEEFRAEVKQVLDEALQGQSTDHFIFPLFTKEGERVEVLLNATPRLDSTGQIVGVFGVGQDITKITETQSELSRVAEDMKQVIDTANAPIFGIDASGLVNEWNRKAAQITGFSKDEVMGEHLVNRYISEEYRASVTEVLSNALNGQNTDNFTFPLFKKNGERVEVLLNATTRRNASGGIVGVVGVGQDITDRKDAETRVSLLAADLRLLIDNANAPIIGIDAFGCVNEWNNKAAEITGYTQAEVTGRYLVRDFIIDEYKVAVNGVLANALQGKATDNFEFPFITKSGQRVEVLLNATTRRDTAGKTLGVLGVGQDITELKQGKAELLRVANDLRLLIDTANAPIFGIGADGLVNEWNRKMAAITGFSKDEVMGQDLVEQYITEEFRKSVKEVLENALMGVQADNYQLPLFTKDGKRVELLLNAATRCDASGAIVGVVGVGQDITEITQSQAELSRVANDFRMLIETANAPIFGIDASGYVNEWNRKAAHITGFSKDEVMGRSLVKDFITADYQNAVQEVLQNALRGEETANFEFPLYTKEGERVEVLLNAATRRNAVGAVTGVLGVGQDITDRKDAETRVSLLAADLRLLIDSANAPIIGIDAFGCVNEWNNKAAEITGYTQAEATGRYLVRDFIIDEYKVAVNSVLANALQGNEADNFEFPFITKDGRRVEVLLNATTRRDTAGKTLGVLGVGQDITELKQGKAELLRVANDLRLLIDTANAPIFGIGADGHVNEWNRKMAAITGFSKHEVMGQDLVEQYITEEFRKSVKEVLENALLGVQTDNYQLPLFTKDGKRVELLLNAATRCDASGAIVGVVGVGQDITAINKSQAELSRVANDLTQLIETANAPIFGIDKDGRVNEWNRKTAHITGFSKAEVMGQDLVRKFITAEYQDSVREVLLNALTGEETANYELPLYTKDGRRVEVLLNATTRRNVEGTVTGVVGVGQDITEMNRGKQELYQVANALTRLIDTANAPIIGTDVNGLVNEWNRKAAEITGYSREEVINRHLTNTYIMEEYRHAVQEVLELALGGRSTDNFIFPLMTKDGRRVEVLLNATNRVDAAGNIIGVVGVGQDITRLSQAQAEMSQVADDLKMLIETANAPIFGIDASGLVNEWNRKAAQITGYSKNDVLGRNLVEDFITPEFQASVKEVLDNALLGVQTDNFEFPLYTMDGAMVYVLLNASSRRHNDGNIVGVVGVGQDITSRKQVGDELAVVATDLRLLIDSANAPILGTDAAGRVNEWNNKAAEITGYTKAEVTGRYLVRDFIIDEYKVAVNSVLSKALQGKETDNFEFPFITKSGQRVEVLLNATTRRDTSGKTLGVLGVGQDITELKQGKAELLRVANDLRLLIDTANAPIFGIGADGHVNEWNRKMAAITGFSKDEVMGQDLVEQYITEEFRKSVKEVLANALLGVQTDNYQLPLFTKDGKRVELLLNAATRCDASGVIVGVVGVGQDITAINQGQAELSRVANDLTQLIETANAPIFGIDTNGYVNEWNRKAAYITGFGKDEVMGQDLVRKFITAEYQDSVREVLQNALGGEETANFEFPLYTKDGQRVDVLLNAATRRDTDGLITGVVGVGQDITEMNRGKQELHQVANALTRLIDTANAPIFGIDANGLINEWNRKAAEITGYSKDEVMGRSLVKDFITADYQESVWDVLDKALSGVETANFEFPLYTKEGDPVDILLNAATRRGPDTTIIGVVGVGQNITELKTEKEQLSVIAQDLMRLIDYANAPIFGIDRTGKVNEWNRKAVAITGFSKEDVLGRNLVEDFITPEFQASVKEVLDNALLGKGTDNFEFPLYSSGGKKVAVLLNATPRVDISGQPIGVIGVGQDITERKNAEQDVIRLALDLQRMIDAANAPILGVDSSGLISEWNKNLANVTGYSKQEVLGMHLAKCGFIDPSNRNSVGEVFDHALQGVDCQNFEFLIHSKDGRHVELLLNAASRRNASGQIMGVVGVGQDITEKKYIEKAQINAAKMRASNDAKGNFLASMSHEMRTPLNGVLGMLQLAMSHELPPQVWRHVQNAYMSGEHLLNLVNDILDVSKIEAGKLELESKLFNLHDVFSTAMGIVKPQATHKGLTLNLQVPEDFPKYARGDQQRTRQVLLNLLYNAVKFTVAGSVTLNASIQEETQTHFLVLVRVEDQGIGISKEDQSKLFGMFAKIKDARVRNPLGVGLGLAICKQLVEMMGGQIWVDSTYGEGSTFSFTLQLEKTESEAEMLQLEEEERLEAEGPQMQCAERSLRILVAEDNEFNMEVVKTMLTQMGHQVDAAWNGSEAIELLFDPDGKPIKDTESQGGISFSFDVVFMDCNMPVLDGYEASEFIRKNEGRLGLEPPLPIIALTAYAMPGDQDKCLTHGMTDYLTKPMTKEALLKMINKHAPRHSPKDSPLPTAHSPGSEPPPAAEAPRKASDVPRNSSDGNLDSKGGGSGSGRIAGGNGNGGGGGGNSNSGVGTHEVSHTKQVVLTLRTLMGTARIALTKGDLSTAEQAAMASVSAAAGIKAPSLEAPLARLVTVSSCWRAGAQVTGGEVDEGLLLVATVEEELAKIEMDPAKAVDKPTTNKPEEAAAASKGAKPEGDGEAESTQVDSRTTSPYMPQQGCTTSSASSQLETCFDFAKALEQLGGDEEMLHNMLSSFVQHGKNAMSKLCAHKDSSDMVKLGQEAHSLKGSSSFIAARYLPKLAGQLEKAARENEEAVSYLVGQILHQFSLLEKDIAVRLKLPEAAAADPPDAAPKGPAAAAPEGTRTASGTGLGPERRSLDEGSFGSSGAAEQRSAGLSTAGCTPGQSLVRDRPAEQRNPAASCEVPLFKRAGPGPSAAQEGVAVEGVSEVTVARRLHETRETVLKAASSGYGNPAFRTAVRQLHQEALAASIQYDVALQTAFLLMRATERAKGAEVAVVVARLREDAQASRLVPANVKDGRRGGVSSSISSDYEMALRRGGEDEDVRLRFKNRSEAVLSRIQEALTEQNYRRIHREAHSLKSIALYMGAERVTKAAHKLQEAASASEPQATQAAAEVVASELAQITRSVEGPNAPPGSATANVRVDVRLNALINKCVDLLFVAAAADDVKGMRDLAKSLKDMVLTHGPKFDMLAIAAYQLQKAAEAGPLSAALTQLHDVCEAAAHTRQLILYHTARDSHMERGSSCWWAACVTSEASRGARTFFSHVCVSAARATRANSNVPEPFQHSAALTEFNGDAVVLARMCNSFLQLVPAWLTSCEQALEQGNLLVLRGEVYIFACLARLVCAQPLAAVLRSLQSACEAHEPIELLRRWLVRATGELRLLMCLWAQPARHEGATPRRMLLDTPVCSRVAFAPAPSAPPGTEPEPSPAPAAAAPELQMRSCLPPQPQPSGTGAPTQAALRHAARAEDTPVERAPRTSLLSGGRSSTHGSVGSQGSRQFGGEAVMVAVPAKALNFVLETSASLASLVRGARDEERMLAFAAGGDLEQADQQADLDHQLLVAQQLAGAAIGVLRRFIPENTGVAAMELP